MRCQKIKSSFLFQILWQFLIQINFEFLCGDLPEDPLFPFTSLRSILTAQVWLLFLLQIQWLKGAYKFILYLLVWNLTFDFSCSVNYKEGGRRASGANTIWPLPSLCVVLETKGPCLSQATDPKWLQILDHKRQCLSLSFYVQVTLKYWKTVSSFIDIVGKVQYSH